MNDTLDSLQCMAGLFIPSKIYTVHNKITHLNRCTSSGIETRQQAACKVYSQDSYTCLSLYCMALFQVSDQTSPLHQNPAEK